MKLRHEFVESVPDVLLEATLYVSIKYATTMHKCCCGCGNTVVAPLSPNDWLLTFDGETVSLDPSIGNWSFPCQSHYWIREDEVVWARRWSAREIKVARERERRGQKRFYQQRGTLKGEGSIGRIRHS